MWKPLFEFGDSRIVHGNTGDGLGCPCMRLEGKENLVLRSGGLNYGEEGLSEIDRVDVEVIRVAAEFPPPDGQRKADGALGR